MNRRVLLVDDGAEFLEGVRAVLGARFQVELASSGAEALERCEARGPFAAVVSDYAMPGMNGIELLACLRERWPDTVRIMLTGCAELQVALEALDEGALFRFLTKPPSPARLVAALEAAVERYRLSEEERLVTEQLLFARESLLSLSETLERRLERELGRLDALERLAETLRGCTSLEEIAEATAAAVRRLFGGRAALVVLRDANGGREIRSGEPGAGDGEHHRETLLAGKREIGCIQLGPALAGPALSAGDRRALAILASAAALAAEGALRRRESEEAKRATIFALARLAENRDDGTGAHLERVSDYCRFLALALREDGFYPQVLTEAFVSDIALAAPLHDIGKVAIPDSILFKPGKLDEHEWAIMRTHASVGAETLRGVLESSGEQSFLRMAHEIAWCHHERWDGTGYPRGLAREAIPLSARIMALADCYDALTNVRPYKRAWSHREALDYIGEQRERAFDPVLVDAFLRRSRQVAGIRERYEVAGAARE